jgi:protein-tyrosine phosphatase
MKVINSRTNRHMTQRLTSVAVNTVDESPFVCRSANFERQLPANVDSSPRTACDTPPPAKSYEGISPSVLQTPQPTSAFVQAARDVEAALRREADPSARCLEFDATRLTDWLFVGSFPSPDVVVWLCRSLGVTHIVNACSGEKLHGNLPLPILNLSCIDDQDCYILDDNFHHFQQFVDSARSQGGIVFVHCMAGVNRSVALCAAYLIYAFGWTAAEAVSHVRACGRAPVLTNSSFRRQLVDFQCRNHQ